MARRCRGLVCAAHNALDDALHGYDQALEVFDGPLAMPFEQARTRYLRGHTHRRAGHRRAARTDLLAAHEVFDRLGAAAWRERAGQELSRLGGRAPSGSELTAAERAVAELAAAGRSNREIAAELVVSVRTVEGQLSAAYRKLDIRSRIQLAGALAAAGRAATRR
jgi:DNA-binding CsgD family transcriptional regulator